MVDGASSDGIFSATLTPFDVLFNTDTSADNGYGIPLLNVNFFDIPSDTTTIRYKFRSAIAIWYYALRTIASAILLVVLIYVGIRMALSTVSAEEKAKYKKMLVDWVVSLALIFLMQYIMLFIIYVNDALVNAISKLSDSTEMREAIDAIGSAALNKITIDSIGATIVYCMLIGQTFGLFIAYFKRMLTLAFLTLISPLITLTYSIDKIGDGKAQALNTWLKEYVFTTLIQPFHCIIYMAFVSVGIQLLTTSSGGITSQLAASIITIICIRFIKEAEEIIRKIFAFGDSGKSANLAAGMAVATVAAKKAKSIGKGTKKAITSVASGVKSFKSGAGKLNNILDGAVIGAASAKRYLSGDEKNNDGSEKTLEQIKSEERTNLYNKRAEKIEKKKYGVSEKDEKTAKKIKDAAKILQGLGYSPTEAKARARLNVAKENREKRKKEEKDKNLERKHPKIYKARGTIRKVKEIASQSETLKELGNMANVYASLGAGLAFGSMTYGTGDNLYTALATGTAVYKGSRVLLTNSHKTLTTSVSSRLKSLGVTNRGQASAEYHSIMTDPNVDSEDKLNQLVDEVDQLLRKLGIDSVHASQIQGTFMKIITKDPSRNIDDVVRDALTANGINPAQSRSLTIAAKNLAVFDQRREIYKETKSAGDIGISADRFVEDTVNKFPTGGDSNYISSISKSNEEFIDESIGITENEEDKENLHVAPDDESTREFVYSRDDDEIEEFYKDCDKEMDDINRQLTEDIPEDSKDELIAKLNQIEATKEKVQDMELDKKIEELNEEAQEKIKQAGQDMSKEAQKKLETELKDLQVQYNNYINQINSRLEERNSDGEFERNGIKYKIDGIKSTTELKNQMYGLRRAKAIVGYTRTILPNTQDSDENQGDD